MNGKLLYAANITRFHLLTFAQEWERWVRRALLLLAAAGLLISLLTAAAAAAFIFSFLTASLLLRVNIGRYFLFQILISAGAIPLTFGFFGEGSIISPIANFFAVPAVGIGVAVCAGRCRFARRFFVAGGGDSARRIRMGDRKIVVAGLGGEVRADSDSDSFRARRRRRVVASRACRSFALVWRFAALRAGFRAADCDSSGRRGGGDARCRARICHRRAHGESNACL